MNSFVTEKALTLYSFMLAYGNERKEKGQGTLEYVGIVIIAAALVAALVGAVDAASIGTKVKGKITEILGN